MPSNACLFDRALLDRPMRRADPLMQMAFETRAKELLEHQRAHQGVVGRVRDVVRGQLGGGEPSMASSARAMAMSTATLRRRLAAEGTSFTDILDGVRSELARVYLSDPNLSTREVAFLLGYSHAKAFYEAFRRWTGEAPSDFRAKAREP
jgi:AraC-like DNA-binding protein